MKQKYLAIFFIVIVLAAFAFTVSAQQPKGSPLCNGGPIDEKGKCILVNPATQYLDDTKDFGVILKKVVQILMAFAGGIAVIFLIIGGYRYVVSRGNEEAMEGAKKTITAAILGIVIIIMAYAIVAIVNQLVTGPPPT